MKITKKIFAFVAAIALAFTAFAQDDADFGDDFGSFDSSDSSEESSVKIGGEISAAARVYVDQREDDDEDKTISVENWKTWAMPSAKLDFAYTGNASSFSARLKFDKNSLGDYKWDILDEFKIAAFLGNFQVEAGKMRIVWGKGDKLHVLDNFNANDYTDYIIPDYLDRRIAEMMFHLVYTTNNNVKIEAVYTPWMTPDRLGSGIWTPKASRQLTQTVEDAVKGKLAAAFTNYTDMVTTTGVLKGDALAYAAAGEDFKQKAAVYAAAGAAYKAIEGDFTKLVGAQVAATAVNPLAPTETEMQAAQLAVLMDPDNAAMAQVVTAAKTAEAAAMASFAEFNAVKKTWKENVTKLGKEYDYDAVDMTKAGDDTGFTPVVMQALLTQYGTEYMTTLTSASGFDADDLYPDTYKLKYGQAGARLTFTAGPVDLGFSYYFGRNKQPSVNKLMLLPSFGPIPNPAYFGGDIEKIKDGELLDYDRLQVFGFEGAYVIPGVGLNTRWEVAYNLTEDIDGDDPVVANNSLAWVVGFDRDIPLHNININIQTQGKLVLKHDKIEDMGAFKALDVDYVQKNDDGDGLYTNNKLVFDITDTWNYEKVKLDLKVIWGIERTDLLVMPTVTFNLTDSFNLDVSGLFIWCKDEYSEFDGWEHNSFGQIACKYKF